MITNKITEGLAFFFLLIHSFANAQIFTTYNFSSSGFPFSVGLPANSEKNLEKSIKNNPTDTTLTVYTTVSNTTYVLTISRVKNAVVAERTVPGVVSRLEQIAQKISQKKTETLLKQTSTYLDYTNEKGSYMSIQVLSLDRYVIQIYTLSKNSFLTSAQNQTFFNTLVFTGTITNTSTTNTTSSNSTTTISNNSGWQLYDRGEIFDSKENKWFGCTIIKVNSDGTYKIAYDGYGENYDEDVNADRIAKPTSNTTPNVPYIRIQKGNTIYAKGNLKNGQIMEDLEWAELSSMACWPGIRNVEFEGNHVGYWFDLPKKSIVKITVTPTVNTTRINLYGYSGFDLKKTPPEVSRCVSCEASHPTWIGEPNLSEPAQSQTIEFNTTTRHTAVYFAVAGARNVLQGDYTISISVQ